MPAPIEAETPRVPGWLYPAFLVPAALFFIGLAVENETLRVAVKAIPVLTLAIAVGVAAPRIRYRMLIAVGLVFGAAGDLLLEVDLFEIGLVAFLIGQLFYTAAFLGDEKTLKPVPAVVFYVYGITLVWLLAEGAGDLLIPIAAYAVAICTMLWRAVARIGSVPRITGMAAAIGAAFFVVSDSLIAIDRFGTDVAGARWWIMTTYLGAQALIALSAFRHEG